MGRGGGCGKCYNHPIRDWFRRTFGGKTSGHSSSYEREESYDPQTAQLQETMRINNALTAFRLDIEKESDKLERDVIKESRYSLDQFIKSLREYNNKVYAGRKLNINIDAIERENRDTEDMIHGFIKKRVLKRISLDDTECLEVLKMEKGKAKAAAMKNFMNKVLKNAVEDLIKELKKIIYKQCDNVVDKIQGRLDDIEYSSADVLKNYEEISALKESDEIGLETKKAKIMSDISICDVAILMVAEL